MSDKKTKKLTFIIPFALWKKVKILSIHNEITLNEQVCELLEKVANNKKVENIYNSENAE